MKRWVIPGALLIAAVACADGGPDPIRSSKATRATRQKKCAAGDAAACRAIAGELVDIYFSSSGGSVADGKRAVALFERSCKLGDIQGCRDVAWCLDEGMIHRDTERAITMYRQLCDKGDAGSCALLGSKLQEKQPDEAMRLFEKACSSEIGELGCLSGCNNLGSIYRWGRGKIAKNLAKAVAYHDRACTSGCTNSCDTLGMLVVDADAERAARSWQRACTLRFAPSCDSLSQLYERGRGVAQDAAKAKQLFTRACTLSHNQVSRCPKD